MSYQLEREMQYRVDQYRREAAVRRAVPGGKVLRQLAVALRRVADLLEARATGKVFLSEGSDVVLQGRNR